MYALVEGRVHTGYGVLDDHAVVIENGIIQDVVPEENLNKPIKKIAVAGHNISAGLIDLQVNGCGGVQFNETQSAISVDTLKKMQACNLRHGCTNFLPTLITASDAFIKLAVEAIEKFQQNYPNQVLGLHLEGPYISKIKKGIHDEKLIRKPSQSMIDYLCGHADFIKVITLAPEEVEPRTIRQLADAGITVSIGHSNADYQQANVGFASGITMATHLFNAMSALESRSPNTVGAIFDRYDINAGIIADGMHVDWMNIRMSHKLKLDHLFLVTDAILPAGTDIEKWEFGGKTIFHQNGKCTDKNGTLAGSALTMDQAVRNTINHVGLSLDEALRMATLYPAKAITVDTKFGSIAKNKIANLTVFDNQLHIKKTIVNGRLV